MKANELRIGNYFLFGGEVDKWQFGHWKDLEQEDDYIGEPIPLTEEWLKRFGFVKLKVPVKSYIDKMLDRHYWEIPWPKDAISHRVFELSSIGEDGTVCWLADDLNTITACVQYVHELQNLYFAVYKDELKTKD